jgi:hypothetical protein
LGEAELYDAGMFLPSMVDAGDLREESAEAPEMEMRGDRHAQRIAHSHPSMAFVAIDHDTFPDRAPRPPFLQNQVLSRAATSSCVCAEGSSAIAKSSALLLYVVEASDLRG